MSSDAKVSTFRRRLADKIGPRQFNRLVESVTDAKRKGRLRFWQQRLIDLPSLGLNADENQFLNAFGEYEAFIFIFADAERLGYTVTKEEFLANSVTFFDDPKCDIPDGWIYEAWQVDDFRDSVSEMLAFSIAMVNTLDWADGITDTLARVLPHNDAVTLYESIRSELHMPESEWRHHFIKAFPIVEKTLTQQNPT